MGCVGPARYGTDRRLLLAVQCGAVRYGVVLHAPCYVPRYLCMLRRASARRARLLGGRWDGETEESPPARPRPAPAREPSPLDRARISRRCALAAALGVFFLFFFCCTSPEEAPAQPPADLGPRATTGSSSSAGGAERARERAACANGRRASASVARRRKGDPRGPDTGPWPRWALGCRGWPCCLPCAGAPLPRLLFVLSTRRSAPKIESRFEMRCCSCLRRFFVARRRKGGPVKPDDWSLTGLLAVCVCGLGSACLRWFCVVWSMYVQDCVYSIVCTLLYVQYCMYSTVLYSYTEL